MILMAVAGAAVLVVVCWAALREAQRMPGRSVSAHRRPVASTGAQTPSGGQRNGHPPSATPAAVRIGVVRDATVAGADTDEALAAAAALWQVLVHEQEHRNGR